MGANFECLRKPSPVEESKLEISVPIQRPQEAQYRLTFESTHSNTADFCYLSVPKPLQQSPLNPSLSRDRSQSNILSQSMAKNPSEIIEFFTDKFGEFDNSKPLDSVEVRERSTMDLLDGISYKGEWDLKGRRHGRGIEYLPDGGVYIGYFKKNQRAFKGRLIHGNGTFYQGHFSEGKPHGFGFYVHEDGSEYQGTFQDGLQHGRGKEKYPGKSYYEGDFLHGKKHGSGAFHWADGKMYKGEFTHGLMNGHGEFSWPNGNVYIGNWLNGKMHGFGSYLWADGRKYTGEYINNKKHGSGKMTWPDGTECQGRWENGKLHGTGETTSACSSGQHVAESVVTANRDSKRI